MTDSLIMTAGKAWPMGAVFDGAGVNFAVFSAHATRIVLCLFDDNDHEIAQFDLARRSGDIWHGHVAGVGPGQRYGYRAHGPFAPHDGHRFNPNKLLIDPYARHLTGHPVWHDALLGYDPALGPDSFSTLDSAPYMPRCVVVDPRFDWGDDRPPATPLTDTIIYEAHIKGLTQRHPTATPQGKIAALASPPMIAHLTRLGITAVELLPIHAFVDDKFLHDRGLSNYWGYQSIGFFAPDPRYLTGGGGILEVQDTVARLHHAGLEVILDVVYNHTGEGDEFGPTLSFRGLDNASYYRLADDPRRYVNDTGTGNTVNIGHPMVLRMVMDSLRYWVNTAHVDGFRFDLGVTLGRAGTGNEAGNGAGFDPGATFFDTLRQDPVLAAVKLIAEPWDIGPGGYRLGAFPPPFLEWNDRFRDTVRRFWRGDGGMVPDLADCLTGSARQFDHSGRSATSSVNFLTAHDGFTLHDLVSYAQRHNAANGEDNRDGHGENLSDNMGVEGLSDDAAICAARARRRRNMLATLMLSQGTPMLLAGDEIGNSQGGNNNAYAQDNPIGWLDWDSADPDMSAFTAALIGFRRDHPVLRQDGFLHGQNRAKDGARDLVWWREDGAEMTPPDWHDSARRILCAELRGAAHAPSDSAVMAALFVVLNAGAALDVALPPAPDGQVWVCQLDSGAGATPGAKAGAIPFPCPAETVLAFALEPVT